MPEVNIGTILHDLKRIAQLKREHAELDKKIVAALDKVCEDIFIYERGNYAKQVNERSVLGDHPHSGVDVRGVLDGQSGS